MISLGDIPAFFLNLDRRPDRRRALERRLAEAGLSAERFPAVDGKTIPTRPHLYSSKARHANAASFSMILREAERRRAKACLILEDDAMFGAVLVEALAALAIPDDWDIVYLGCHHMMPPLHVAPGVVRAVRPYGNHAMLIHSRVYRIVRKAMRAPVPFESKSPPGKDHKLAHLAPSLNVYACLPNLVWQGGDFSDIENGHTRQYREDGRSRLSNFQPTNIP